MPPCQFPTSLNFNNYISPIIHKYVFPSLPINNASGSPILIDPFHRAANVMHLGVVRRGFRCLGGFSLMVDGDGLSSGSRARFELFLLRWRVGVTHLVLLLGPRVMFAAN